MIQILQHIIIRVTKEMKTDKKGTCVYEKDIHVSHKGQGAATNREKGQGVTRTRAAPCKNGLARTLDYIYMFI